MKTIGLYQSRVPLIAHEYKIYNLLMDKVELTSDINKHDILLISLYKNQDIILTIDSKVKIVLIVDDLWSIRNHCKLSIKDKMCIKKASSYIFLSSYFIAYVPTRGKPRMVLHLKPNELDLHFVSLTKIPKSIVYSGKYLKEKWEDRKTKGGYRAYHMIFAELITLGWTVYILTHTKEMKAYENIGCKVIKNIPQNQIYKYLSQFELGLHGFNFEDIPNSSRYYINQCIPNKTWEYLAAGIPTLSYNGGFSSLLLHEKWGYKVDNLEEINKLDFSQLPLETYRKMEIIDNYKNELWELVNNV